MYTPCAIYAKKDISKNERLYVLAGELAQCNSDDMAVYDDHFSLMVHKKKQCVMLGPASFVNHSCRPNTMFRYRTKTDVFGDRPFVYFQTTK